MAYCTQNDLLTMIPVKELAELTADSGDTPDSQVVAEAIQRADAEIDSYLGMRYMLPLNPVPDQVMGLAMDMALYHLYSRRSVVPAVRQQKYEAAVSLPQAGGRRGGGAGAERRCRPGGNPDPGGGGIQQRHPDLYPGYPGKLVRL